MRQNDRHQHKADNRVPKLRILHLFMRGHGFWQDAETQHFRQAGGVQDGEGLGKHRQFEREQQRQTRDRDGPAQNDHRPEDQFLTRVELLGRGMSAAEKTTALGQPLEVCLVGEVVHDPHHEDHHQRQHEGPGHVVMYPFRCPRDQRIAFVSDGRNQEFAPHERHQTRDPQQDERPRQKPMTEAFKVLEALDPASGLFTVDLDPTAQQEEQHQRADRAKKQIPAIGQQRAFAEQQPPHAAVLDQHIGCRSARLGRYIRRVESHPAPQIGIGGATKGAQLIGDASGRRRIADVFGPERIVDRQALLATHDVFQRRRATRSRAIDLGLGCNGTGLLCVGHTRGQPRCQNQNGQCGHDATKDVVSNVTHIPASSLMGA